MTTHVKIYPGKVMSVLQFRYDPSVIELVKTFIGREYNPDNRTWSIYTSDVEAFIIEAKKIGVVCGKVYGGDSDKFKTDDPPRGRYANGQQYDYFDFNNRSNNSRSSGSSGSSSSGRTRPRSSGVGNDWACQLFVAVGPELTGKAYKVMSRVVHPDVGDSENLMKQLNSAYDLYKKK